MLIPSRSCVCAEPIPGVAHARLKSSYSESTCIVILVPVGHWGGDNAGVATTVDPLGMG